MPVQILVRQIRFISQELGVFHSGVVEFFKIFDTCAQLPLEGVVFCIFPDRVGGSDRLAHLSAFTAKSFDGIVEEVGKMSQLRWRQYGSLGIHDSLVQGMDLLR